MVQMNLIAGQEYKHSYKRMYIWTWVREGGWDELGDYDWHIYTAIYEIDS